jgi:hypothetical protein
MTNEVIDINDKLEISRLKSQIQHLRKETEIYIKVIGKLKEECFILNIKDLRQQEMIKELEKLLINLDVTILK